LKPFPPDIFIVVGDPSADLYASLLAREIHQRLPQARLRGVGGPRMVDAGVEVLVDSSQWSRLGLFDTLTAAPSGFQIYARLKRLLRTERPSLFIAVDWGAVNMRLLKHCHQLNVPTLYYIPPRCWDAHAYVSEDLVRCATKIATPFRWSEERLRAAGADVTFVGHPVLDTTQAARGRAEVRCSLNVRADETLIAILPGSRRLEIRYNLPVLLEAAQHIQIQRPRTRFAIGLASSVKEERVQRQLRQHPVEGVHVLQNQTFDLLRACDLALVASGTATLEAACLGTPMIIVYAAPWFLTLQAVFARKLDAVIGLPNIIAQDIIVPEITGRRFTPQNLTDTTLQLLDDPKAIETMRQRLRQVRQTLGESGATARTADLVMELISMSNVQCPSK
jgi:lipid-A-disaccharide synthase